MDAMHYVIYSLYYNLLVTVHGGAREVREVREVQPGQV